MLPRITSHICERLFLPMLLLRVGLFMLMNMDSLIVPANLCPSLTTMLKFSNVVGWSVVDGWP